MPCPDADRLESEAYDRGAKHAKEKLTNAGHEGSAECSEAFCRSLQWLSEYRFPRLELSNVIASRRDLINEVGSVQRPRFSHVELPLCDSSTKLGDPIVIDSG